MSDILCRTFYVGHFMSEHIKKNKNTYIYIYSTLIIPLSSNDMRDEVLCSLYIRCHFGTIGFVILYKIFIDNVIVCIVKIKRYMASSIYTN